MSIRHHLNFVTDPLKGLGSSKEKRRENIGHKDELKITEDLTKEERRTKENGVKMQTKRMKKKETKLSNGVLGEAFVVVSIKFIQDSCKRCLLYTSPSPRDATLSRMPSSA